MNSKPTQEQIDKLPKWAREHLADVQRERDVAVRSLLSFQDEQTKSPIWYDDNPCIGIGKGPAYIRRYIQHYNINIQHAGVLLRVSTHEPQCIILSYNDENRDNREIAMVPKSFQQLELISKGNLRA